MRTATEPLTCIECRRVIEVGETYQHDSGMNPDDLDEDEMDEDGEPTEAAESHREHFHTCLGCKRIAARFCPGGYCVTQLVEAVAECLGYHYTEDPEGWDDEEVDEEDRENREAVLEGRARG
jgi:hypothetical protein